MVVMSFAIWCLFVCAILSVHHAPHHLVSELGALSFPLGPPPWTSPYPSFSLGASTVDPSPRLTCRNWAFWQAVVDSRPVEATEDDASGGEGDDRAKSDGSNVMNCPCVSMGDAGQCDGTGGFIAPCWRLRDAHCDVSRARCMRGMVTRE